MIWKDLCKQLLVILVGKSTFWRFWVSFLLFWKLKDNNFPTQFGGRSTPWKYVHIIYIYIFISIYIYICVYLCVHTVYIYHIYICIYIIYAYPVSSACPTVMANRFCDLWWRHCHTSVLHSGHVWNLQPGHFLHQGSSFFLSEHMEVP